MKIGARDIVTRFARWKMQMANTSATGGYLRRTASNPTELRDFIHDWLAGLTGLANELVRPAWQINPPTLPSNSTDWVAFAILNKQTEKGFPFQKQILEGLKVEISSEETLEILVSFYGPSAFVNVDAFRDALFVTQNSEPLLLRGLGLQNVGAINHVPELVNDLWYDRWDVIIYINREVLQSFTSSAFPAFDILSIEKVEGELITENLTVNFEIEEPPE